MSEESDLLLDWLLACPSVWLRELLLFVEFEPAAAAEDPDSEPSELPEALPAPAPAPSPEPADAEAPACPFDRDGDAVSVEEPACVAPFAAASSPAPVNSSSELNPATPSAAMPTNETAFTPMPMVLRLLGS